MERTDKRLSPSENKVLEFAVRKHEGMKRIQGNDYIEHPIAVAEYLYDRRYRGKYVFTALCHDLLEDTDTTEEEIFNVAGRFTRDAVKLLTKNKGADIKEYLEKIKSNEVAYIVKVADRIDNLWDAIETGVEFRKKYLLETEQYYLDFAKESPFLEDLTHAYESLKEFHAYEEQKKIIVDVDNAYKAVFGDVDLNILDSFNSGFGSLDSSDFFPIACLLNLEDIEIAETAKGKQIAIRLRGFPTSELKIYKDEEAYNLAKQNEFSFASSSFVPSWEIIICENMEIPDPNACFTGSVKMVEGPILNQEDDEDFNYYIVDIETLGIIVSVGLREDEFIIPEVGNIVSGVYRLYGYIDKEKY